MGKFEEIAEGARTIREVKLPVTPYTGNDDRWNSSAALVREQQAAEAQIEENLRILDRPGKPRCVVCGGPADMNASRGPACQDHYDDLSDKDGGCFAHD
jgi:hypothetical protein